tara:strand:- start:3603 stop:4337 length:735 start_codon:yes stop_codon:yes gene_type:complete
MKLIYFLLFLNLNISNSFILNYKMSFLDKKMKNVHVVQKDIPKTYLKCAIFFTGGSGFAGYRIYKDFLNILAIKDISIYVPSFNYNNINNLIEILKSEYDEVILIGHSSGCSSLLNNCNLDNIKKIILLDPVNTRLINKDKNKYILSNSNNVLFITAEKSYKITFDPFGLPFIPGFVKLNNESIICNNSIKYYIYPNNGHTDILNKNLSNFMHYSRASVGDKQRNVYNYHRKVGKNIYDFIYGI